VERDTVRVYEERAGDWQARRPAGFLDDVRALRDATPTDEITVDLGCGAGGHLAHLGRPVVALDAALPMLGLARESAPDAWPVQADLEALPFRRGALGAAWARASYLHVREDHLPRALADLHRSLAVGAPGVVVVRADDRSGYLAGDDFAGRWFAGWSRDPLHDVLTGSGFDVESLDATGEWLVARVRRARTLADTVGPGMGLLVCGLNPSLRAADAGVGFVTPGNRFWPAALAAGLVTVDRDPWAALSAGVGMTDLVKRATPRAAELTSAEYRAGHARLERLTRWLQPGAVCFVGLAGWRAAVDRNATAGLQPAPIGGRPAYVMPSTSGLNARVPLVELADHLRAAVSVTA
jgi:TDG/mug DNA glycosylase family protein